MGMQTFIDLLLALAPGIIVAAVLFGIGCEILWGIYRGWTDYEPDKKHQVD